MYKIEVVPTLPEAPDDVVLWQEDDWPRFVTVGEKVYEVGEHEGRLVKRRRPDYEYPAGH